MDGAGNHSGTKIAQQTRKTINKIEEPRSFSKSAPVTSEPSRKSLKNSRVGTFHQNKIRRSTVRLAAGPHPEPEERRYCRYLTKNMLIGLVIVASILGIIAIAVITVVALKPADRDSRSNTGDGGTGGA